MRSVTQFIKHTIAGGLLFMIPLFVIYTIAVKLWKAISGVGAKLSELIGIKGTVIGIDGGPLVSSFLILLMFFTCGLLYRISLVGKFRAWVDSLLLQYIPGYDIYKANFEKKIKPEDFVIERPVVLITIHGISEVGVLADTMPDGRKVVFVANTPGSTTGRVYIAESGMIQPLDIKESEMNKIQTQQGKGWGTIL